MPPPLSRRAKMSITGLAAAYDGAHGKTRREVHAAPRSDGSSEKIELVRVVHAGTDPALAEQARRGALNADSSGAALAASFLYHDPEKPLLAVVVPESLRHDGLRERARWLTKILEDPDRDLPSYVLDLPLAVGAKGLDTLLSSPTPSERLKKADELRAQEATLREREAALTREATALRERTAFLEGRIAELETMSATLTSRDKHLRARTAALEEREADLRKWAAEIEARDRSAVVEDLDSGEAELVEDNAVTSPSIPVEDADPADVDFDGDDGPSDEEVEEFRHMPTDLDRPRDRSERPAKAGRVDEMAVAFDALETVDSMDSMDDEENVLDVEDGEAEPIEDPLDVEPLAEVPQSVRAHHVEPADRALPKRLVDDPDLEAIATMHEGHVRLWARLEDGREDAFASPAVDALCQLATVGTYPVVLLTMVDASGARPYVRRAALDPYAPGDLEVLHALREKFALEARFAARDGRVLRTLAIEAPRRVNVAMILSRIERMERPKEEPTAVLERALAAPPPVHVAGHPFRTVEPAASPRDALDAMRRLMRWSSPARLDTALLMLSIPRDVVDRAFRRILEDGQTWGIALPGPLLSRAVSIGVAAEPAELVAHQLSVFRRVSVEKARGGLNLEERATNWERLLAAAAEHEVPVDPALDRIAREQIDDARSAITEATPVARISEFPRQSRDELTGLLERPGLRVSAARELILRKDVAALPGLYAAVRRMPRGEVLAVVPHLVSFGDAATEVLIDGLGAKKTFVRQASALALGVLRQRRAIQPLVLLLKVEPSEIWEEIARIVGSFGDAAVRAVTKTLKDPQGNEGRFVLALAHLIENGSGGLVESLTRGGGKLADVAKAAFRHRELAREHIAIAAGSAPLPPGDAVRGFTREFMGHLPK